MVLDCIKAAILFPPADALGTRIDSGPATHRHNREAVGIGTINESDVADVGGEISGNGETTTREAAGLGENGDKRSGFWYPSGKEQVLPR